MIFKVQTSYLEYLETEVRRPGGLVDLKVIYERPRKCLKTDCVFTCSTPIEMMRHIRFVHLMSDEHLWAVTNGNSDQLNGDQ